MIRQLTVGLAQHAPQAILPGGEWNIEAFEVDVASALITHPGLDVLVYPELHLCGADEVPESERTETLESSARALDSTEVQALGQIAREAGVWLIPGSICERGENGELFNTELVFDPTGELVAHYRKIFPWRPFEPYIPGTEFVVSAIGSAGSAEATGVAGLSICYDAWYPEVTRHLAWMGAEVVFNVVKTTTPDRAQELVLARANSIANQNFTVSVNCAGPTGRGQSLVVDPEGAVICEAGVDPELIVVTLDLNHVTRVRETGTAGTNRVWSQFRDGDATIPLPLYAGRIDPKTWEPRDSTP